MIESVNRVKVYEKVDNDAYVLEIINHWNRRDLVNVRLIVDGYETVVTVLASDLIAAIENAVNLGAT